MKLSGDNQLNLSVVIASIIIFLPLNMLKAESFNDCQSGGGQWTRFCLIEGASRCELWTENFCNQDNLSPVTRPVSYQGETYEVYIDQEWNQLPLNGFLYQLARDYQKTNKTEMLVAESYGISLLNLRGALHFAREVESELCDTTHSLDNDADAARHFSLSTYLSYHEREEASSAFLTAHEALTERDLKNVKSFKRKMSSLKMDYINNAQGVEFASTLPAYLSKKGLKQVVISEIKNRWVSGEFYLIKTQSVCPH